MFWHSLHERVYRAAEHCFTEARRSDPWIAGRFVQEEREPTWLIAERSLFDVRLRPCSAVVLALALRAAVRAQCGSPSERPLRAEFVGDESASNSLCEDFVGFWAERLRCGPGAAERDSSASAAAFAAFAAPPLR